MLQNIPIIRKKCTSTSPCNEKYKNSSADLKKCGLISKMSLKSKIFSKIDFNNRFPDQERAPTEIFILKRHTSEESTS